MSVEAMTWALAQKTGTTARKAVLLALADRAGFDWGCWPSQETIARETEMTERNVRRVLIDLEQAGLITRKARYKDGHRKTDIITLTGQIVRHEERSCRTSESVIPDNGDSSYRTPVSGEPSVEPSVEPSTSRAPAPLAIVDGRFDLFWEQWPKKTDRKAAVKAFNTAMKTADHEDVIAGLQPWLRYWEVRNEPEFIPYPATWLNKERWKDEPPPVNGSKPKMSRGAEAMRAVLAREGKL